jgi:hypothetical protein
LGVISEAGMSAGLFISIVTLVKYAWPAETDLRD